MPDEPLLTPVTHEDLVFALAYALRFDERGKPHRQASDYMARAAAETLAHHLEMSGFVVMKKPPAKDFGARG